MASQNDEYQYLFDKGFMEVTKEDEKEGNHWIKSTKKFFDTLAAECEKLTRQHPKENPDDILAYAAKGIFDDESLPKETVIKFGCYMYTFLKNSNGYEGCLEIIRELQQNTKVEKITKP